MMLFVMRITLKMYGTTNLSIKFPDIRQFYFQRRRHIHVHTAAEGEILSLHINISHSATYVKLFQCIVVANRLHHCYVYVAVKHLKQIFRELR